MNLRDLGEYLTPIMHQIDIMPISLLGSSNVLLQGRVCHFCSHAFQY